MDDLDHLAEPAKASSRQRRGRLIPPWIQVRLENEKRVKAQAEMMGFDPSILLKPNSRALRRTLDAATTEFKLRQAEQRKRSEDSIPF